MGGFSIEPLGAPHIHLGRMWDYSRMQLELTAGQQAHLSSCRRCLEIFKLCMGSESPEEVEKKYRLKDSAA